MIQLDKTILEDYIDACALVEETKQDIKKLKKKKKTIVQTNVKGSNPEFPYEPQHFKIQGTTFTYSDDRQLRIEEELLEERIENAERIKTEVEAWLNTIPCRMHRIIRYKVFDGLSWEQVARKIGRKATEESVKKEFQRFMKKS